MVFFDTSSVQWEAIADLYKPENLGVVHIPNFILPQARNDLLEQIAVGFSVRDSDGSFRRSVRNELSLVRESREEFQNLLRSNIPLLADASLNATKLRKYESGYSDMPIHKDVFCYDCVAVFVLQGAGDLLICKDEQGADSVAIHTTSGDLVYMRAPLKQGGPANPYHAVAKVQENRCVMIHTHE